MTSPYRGLPDDLTMGEVTLWVRDLDRMTAFYVDGVGLGVLGDAPPELSELPTLAGLTPGPQVVLGDGDRTVLILEQQSALPAPAPGDAGLYHTAVLLDSAPALAVAVASTAEQGDGRFTGSSDHRVSEAFYFDDPEGNGLEIYRDRPVAEWQWQDGTITMTVDPLDPQEFLTRHLPSGPPATKGAPRIGHVHLRVGDIPTARTFIVDGLGFAGTLTMASALFVSAGGYHHHVGLNTWHSRGAGRRGLSLGLASVRINVPEAGALDEVADRLTRLEWPYLRTPAALLVDDPWGTRFQLIAG